MGATTSVSVSRLRVDPAAVEDLIAAFRDRIRLVVGVLEARGFPMDAIRRNLQLVGAAVAGMRPADCGADRQAGRRREHEALIGSRPGSFADVLLGRSPRDARAAALGMLDKGVQPRQLYLEVLGPALQEVGRAGKRV